MKSLRKRRGALLAAWIVTATTLSGVALLPRAAADSEFVAGSGEADARVLRVGPSTGSLALAPSVALALADYRGTVGRGEGRAFEYAALYDSVPEEFQSEFPPVRTTSTEEDSEAGRSETHGPFSQKAWADDDPSGRSRVTVAGFSFPGFIEVSPGRAEARAGVDVAAELRSAHAAVEIDELRLAAGAVVLRGLHWEIGQTTDAGGSAEVVGSFSVGSAVIEGEHHGPLTDAEFEGLAPKINEVLRPAGLVLEAPEVTATEGGAGRVSPLGVSVVPSEVGRQVLAPALEAAQPGREALLTPLLEGCPDCADLVLITDVLLSALAGGGSLDVQLGGGSAFTEGVHYENPFAAGGIAAVATPRSAAPQPDASSHLVTRAAEAPVPESDPTAGASPPTGPPSGTASGGEVVEGRLRSASSTTAGGAWALAVIVGFGALAMGSWELRRLRSAREELMVS